MRRFNKLAIIVIIITFASSVIPISCKKMDETKIENVVIGEKTFSNATTTRGNSASIAIDTNFIKIANETYEFLDFLDQVAKRHSLNFQTLISNINGLNNQNLSFDEQIQKINDIFDEDISEFVIIYMKNFSYNWRIFKEKFPNVSQEELEDAAIDVLKSNTVMQERYTTMSYDCGWRYTLCCAAATAAAVLCHGSCDTTAIAVTAGVGIPACVLLCATVQVSAMTWCYDEYCD